MAVIHMIPSTHLAWSFGDRVRKVRREAGLTQRQLAAELGITAASVDAWEAERNKPRDLQETAERIEQKFGLPRGWMLGYADRWASRGSNPEPTGYRVRLAAVA